MEEKISSLENLVDLKESQLAVLPQVKTKTQKYETQKKKKRKRKEKDIKENQLAVLTQVKTKTNACKYAKKCLLKNEKLRKTQIRRASCAATGES